MSVFGCRCAEDPKCPRQLAGRNVFWRSKSATSRRASANAATAAGSSRSRSSTISASSAGRTRQPWRKTRSPPIQAPTRIASCAPARSFSRRRRVGTAAASASSAVVLMMPVDRGRPPDRVIRGHGQPVDPADDAGRQRGSRGAGRDDVTEPDPLAWLLPTPCFGDDGERDQDDRPVRQDRVDRMTVDDGMLRKVHRMSSYALLARPPVGARRPATEA